MDRPLAPVRGPQSLQLGGVKRLPRFPRPTDGFGLFPGEFRFQPGEDSPDFLFPQLRDLVGRNDHGDGGAFGFLPIKNMFQGVRAGPFDNFDELPRFWIQQDGPGFGRISDFYGPSRFPTGDIP